MIRKIKIHGVKWVDGVGLNESETKALLSEYDFHELDIEACIEENQTARIDAYKDYLFIILHFPKYNSSTKTYILNEFKIFLGKDFIITLENQAGAHIDKIFEKYRVAKAEKDKEIKLSSGFILYEIIQIMLEKMFKLSANVKKDLKIIENRVFDNANTFLVKEIMIKKRNIVVLKHMFNPQVSVLKRIEFHMNEIFDEKIEAYFEDLEDKLDHVVNHLKILDEYIESIEDAFKTLIDIKTNFVIKVLALFSALLLPLTLITSFYGMNIKLPYQDNSLFVFGFLGFSTFFMIIIYFIFKRNGKF